LRLSEKGCGFGMDEKLGKLGEFGVIDLFRRMVRPARDWVSTGIGDDCAVLKLGGAERLLVTTDMLVEDVHFLRDGISPSQLGWKSMAVNLSDIAAMGGDPAAAFLALGLTPDIDRTFLNALRDGLLDCASRFGVDLLGGDTVASNGGLVLSLTVLGRASSTEVVTRNGAGPGDVVFVGGGVGDSAAGLHLLLGSPGQIDPADRGQLLKAHLEPQPQVELGRLLARNHLVTAMIDVSDGVLQDLGHLCEESQVGADLLADQLPVSGAVRRLALSAGRDPLDWALSGGEDYVLLFCVPSDREAEAIRLCEKELEIQVVPIGTIGKERRIRVRRDGVWTRPEELGYDHFRR
jgi:thiamine-monophosphate kinase